MLLLLHSTQALVGAAKNMSYVTLYVELTMCCSLPVKLCCKKVYIGNAMLACLVTVNDAI